jgi:hypothetical protein
MMARRSPGGSGSRRGNGGGDFPVRKRDGIAIGKRRRGGREARAEIRGEGRRRFLRTGVTLDYEIFQCVWDAPLPLVSPFNSRQMTLFDPEWIRLPVDLDPVKMKKRAVQKFHQPKFNFGTQAKKRGRRGLTTQWLGVTRWNEIIHWCPSCLRTQHLFSSKSDFQISLKLIKIEQFEKRPKVRRNASPIIVIPPNDAWSLRVVAKIKAKGGAVARYSKTHNFREVQNVRYCSGGAGGLFRRAVESVGLKIISQRRRVCVQFLNGCKNLRQFSLQMI